MGMFSSAKLLGGAFAALALAGLIWLAQDRFHQKSKADAAAACSAVALKQAGSIVSCLPETRSAIESYRRAEACDGALSGKALDDARFAVRMTCSSEVKALYAQHEAAKAHAADLSRLLDEQKQSGLQAVMRAEARGAVITQRKDNASHAIQAAPGGPDGLVLCDADCLRDITD